MKFRHRCCVQQRQSSAERVSPSACLPATSLKARGVWRGRGRRPRSARTA